MSRYFICVFVLLICCSRGETVFAQEIPLGNWRIHNSYNSIHSVVTTPSRIYAASANGIVVVNPDNSLSTLTKLNGLSGVDITAVAFDQPRNQLLVSYDDGVLDIVRANEIIQFKSLKNSATIPGSKRINHITIRQSFAYLAADYGMVVFDLARIEVKETWRDLGAAGQTLRINESTFLQDSIFLATEKGVLAGDIHDNLLDFAKWKRYNQGVFNTTIRSTVSFNNKILAAISGAGLYEYDQGIWTLKNFSGSDFGKLVGGNHLFIAENNNLWKLNTAGVFTQIQNSLITQPRCATEDSAGKLWIGDQRNGLVSDKTSNFQKYVPNGPTFYGSFRLAYLANSMYSVSGGFANGTASGNAELVNYFSSGLWMANEAWLQNDVTDIDLSGPKTFVASFTSGLQVIENNASTLYTSANSPIAGNKISAIAASADGLWVANYGATQSLLLLKSDNTWQSFSFPVAASQYPNDLLVDKLGQVWMILNPILGGGVLVYNREKNQHVYLTNNSGEGSLPSRSVTALALDRDGQVWVGTTAGVAYFPNPAQVFTVPVNSVKPIFSGRFLLRDETVTSIVADGGNRKWMGTQRGVWLFDPFGEKQLENFTASNSPLLSDRIRDIKIHPTTGEVFFGTDKGVLSFRADATESNVSFGKVKIFPNPVTADFSGVVSISGLSTDATVKVTDVSGKLIWQTFANGGTATWNVRDYTGRRAATGMYLVISVAQDASESVVGKIAVIN